MAPAVARLCVLTLVTGATALLDRQAVVQRHTAMVTLQTLDIHSVLTLGNGVCAVGTDFTLTQTFNDSYTLPGSPKAFSFAYDLNALCDWLTHTAPFEAAQPADLGLRSYNTTQYTTQTNTSVRYPTGYNTTCAAPGVCAGPWTHANPHKANAFQLSLRYWYGAGSVTQSLQLSDVVNASAGIDAWTGVATSSVRIVNATAAACLESNHTAVYHPDSDTYALRVNVTTCDAAALTMRLAFPYAVGSGGPAVSEWSRAYDSAHTSSVTSNSTAADGRSGSVIIARVMDSDTYTTRCDWRVDAAAGAAWAIARTDTHVFELSPTTGRAAAGMTYSMVMRCFVMPVDAAYPVGASLPWMQARAAAAAATLANGTDDIDTTAVQSTAAWADYWSNGSFVDLASSTNDTRAWELERRVILSQYLLRVHSAGATPPQETGLLCNSWSGKFHLEMRFWHHAHWAMWSRLALLQRSDGFYLEELQNATCTAAFQGWDGARWPKMILPVRNRTAGAINVPWLGGTYDALPIAPTGMNTAAAACAAAAANTSSSRLYVWESSSAVGPLLIWQQPHVIWMAEMQRHVANATQGAAAAAAVMQTQQALVFATAAFLASFPYLNGTDGRYWLGPPLYGGEESPDPSRISNPTFERVYLGWALDTANQWLQQLNGTVNTTWAAVASGLAPPLVDPASPPGEPLYSFNYDCACAYVPPGRGTCPRDQFNMTSCRSTMSHPMTAGVVGMVNGLPPFDSSRYGLEATIVNATVAAIVGNWSWGNATASPAVWGWDFPLVALAQCRLGWQPDAVVDMLLHASGANTYTPFGYNWQNAGLPAYMPGNGGLLLAVAAMAAGFGASAGLPSTPCGFPLAWNASVEGFSVPYL